MCLLETERLILRRWRPEDADALIAIAGQPHITSWLPDWRDGERWIPGWIERMQQNYALNKPWESFLGYAMTNKQGQVIGQIGIGGEEEPDQLALAYFMDAAHSGKGYMVEAVRALSYYAMEAYGRNKILAMVQPGNLSSRSVLEKNGFRHEKNIERKAYGQSYPIPFRCYRLDKVAFRNYHPASDGDLVRTFLLHVNEEKLVSPNYTWGRWEWMRTHSMLVEEALPKIGIWENSEGIVAMVLYDTVPNEAHCIVAEGFSYLHEEMLAYAEKAFSMDGRTSVVIDDQDRSLQAAAIKAGFRPTEKQEHCAILDTAQNLHYALPEGFSIVSMADAWDYEKYHSVMWKGFNHDGDAPYVEEIHLRRRMLSSNMLLPELVIAVVAPGGEYASHCGLWYHRSYAYVEPVATVPAYRRMGLGKAAVLEAARRAKALGAKSVLVGSSQLFYYSIGFAPVHHSSFWEKQPSSPPL